MERLKKLALLTAKRVVRELYFKLECYADDEHMNCIAVAFFDHSTDNDIVVARLREAYGDRLGEVRRYDLGKRSSHRDGGAA